jgi:hypothetical protein
LDKHYNRAKATKQMAQLSQRIEENILQNERGKTKLNFSLKVQAKKSRKNWIH